MTSSLDHIREVLDIYDGLTARDIPKSIRDFWVASALDARATFNEPIPETPVFEVPEESSTPTTIPTQTTNHFGLWMSMEDVLKYLGVPDYARTVGTQRSLTTKTLKACADQGLEGGGVVKTTLHYLSKSQRTYFRGAHLVCAEQIARAWWDKHKLDGKPLEPLPEPIEPISLSEEIVDEWQVSIPVDDNSDFSWEEYESTVNPQ